jgi:putative PIN family toxin of toxin-antitoxin system
MRVVLDTSVVVSGLISPRGTPARIIGHWRDRDFVLLYTPAILEELKDVLSRAWLTERLAGVPNHIPDFQEAVIMLGELVTGYVNVAGQVRDPFDEMFLSCAQLGRADYIVSGDRDLLSLREYAGSKIVTPTQFLTVLNLNAASLSQDES